MRSQELGISTARVEDETITITIYAEEDETIVIPRSWFPHICDGDDVKVILTGLSTLHLEKVAS